MQRLKDDEQRFREAVATLGAVTESEMQTAAQVANVHPTTVSRFIRRLAGKPVAGELRIEVMTDQNPELSLPSIEASEADTDLESKEDGDI